MKKNIHIIIVVFLTTIISNIHSQEVFARIDKNRNIQAESLFHDLNSAKDTLILKSDKKINYLYSINKNYSRELDFPIDDTVYKLPLNKLSAGKHVFVAVQSPLRIVFVVHILKDTTVVSSKNLKEIKVGTTKPIEIVATENIIPNKN